MRLTPHFDSLEFACHDGTKVPAPELEQVRDLCHRFLEPLRAEFGPVVVVSGYRTRMYNRRVGGAVHSWHIYTAHDLGVAADVRPARGRPADWAQLLDRLGVPGLGTYSDHVHVDTRRHRARWQG